MKLTVDKMWLQSYKPEKNLENKIWFNKQSNQPTIANRGKTTWKALYTIISNCYAKVAEFSKAKSIMLQRVFVFIKYYLTYKNIAKTENQSQD